MEAEKKCTYAYMYEQLLEFPLEEAPDRFCTSTSHSRKISDNHILSLT